VAEEVKPSFFRTHRDLPVVERALHWVRDLIVGGRSGRDLRNLGLYGEDIACRELERQGYRLIERRARSRLGEIDIVAWDGPVLVFAEVKTRRGARLGGPLEAVDWRKQKKIIALAQLYMVRRRLEGVMVRFDVVGVELGSDLKPRVKLIKGAFEEV
jgi:putative endonuclease